VQPFYAFALRGFPRWMELAQKDVQAEQDSQTVGEVLRIEVGGEWLTVPDLARVEARLVELTLQLTAAACD
jgi:hypothetical protein